jgi:hypothetical protein
MATPIVFDAERAFCRGYSDALRVAKLMLGQ